MNTIIPLSEENRDILAEIFNMGMGRGLGALSKIASKGQEITFELPKVKTMMATSLNEIIGPGSTAMIIQKYSGVIHGSAIFYFPPDAGKQLARLLIGTDIPVEKIETIESDALMEVGNIFINSSIGCLANFLNIEIHTGVPRLVYKDKVANELLQEKEVIHLSAGFRIEHLKIDGHVVLILNDDSIKNLINILSLQSDF